jgi:hypothetical protein
MMGKLTTKLSGQLTEKSQGFAPMLAFCSLRYPAGRNEERRQVNGWARFDKDVGKELGSNHVEVMALNKLIEQIGWPIPDFSRIIFVCNWSPCVHCTEDVIPTFMKSWFGNPTIRVRFRFVNYATPTSLPSLKVKLYTDPITAQEKYNELAQNYGSTIFYKSEYSEAAEGMTNFTETIIGSRRLLIDKLNAIAIQSARFEVARGCGMMISDEEDVPLPRTDINIAKYDHEKGEYSRDETKSWSYKE